MPGSPNFLLVIAALLPSPALGAQTCSIESGPARAALLELYTSEGCSSCPPADRWLSRVGGQYGSRVVPLALHVDYWDSIGWPDRFAQSRFSQRQRERARLGFVYTPQLALNGSELRGFGNAAQFDKALADANHSAPAADIRLQLEPRADRVEVEAVAKAPPGSALYLALTEDRLETRVKAGENRGATLRHDHVVRVWLGPYEADQVRKTSIALKPEWKRGDLGIAAFVEGKGGEVLQAVGGRLCGS